ncbi:MAG: nucleotide exchange factor GrpE [Gemmatimonadaceae bacterium]|jgi:molecular chaperone GrpE|nr:nucleotide exchange factor GrpE [Gemmatimonadaceae bacterium]
MTAPNDDLTTAAPDLTGASPSAASDAAGAAAPAADDAATVALKLLEDQKEKYLRLAAEYDNYRKRTAKERLEAERRGQGDVVKGLLETLDDLRRFALVDPATVDTKTLHEGIQLVDKKLFKSLGGHGLEVLDPIDHPFDPALHEAVGTQPHGDAAKDHCVAQVYQVGYRFHGQLLRPARVVVYQHVEGAGPH